MCIVKALFYVHINSVAEICIKDVCNATWVTMMIIHKVNFIYQTFRFDILNNIITVLLLKVIKCVQFIYLAEYICINMHINK